MNGSALALTLAAGLAALAVARPEGRGSRANDADATRLDPVRSDPTRIRLKSPGGAPGERGESREAIETRFFDALESVAGKGQVLYIGPFVMVGDRTGGLYGNLEIGVSAMENGNWGVHLGFIGVPRETRRTGRGSKLLSIVTEAADAAGLPMDLDVDPTTMRGDAKAPVSKKDLRAWYGRFGFKSVKSLGIDYMARPAKVSASGSAARKVASPARYTVEVASDLFRESGANVTTNAIIASYAKKMAAYGGWGKFPPVLGQVGAVDAEDVEDYEQADEAGHAHELAWSRPITRRDVGREFVLLSDGHHRAYAAARLRIPILVAPYHGLSGQPWTLDEVAAWWNEHGRNPR